MRKYKWAFCIVPFYTRSFRIIFTTPLLFSLFLSENPSLHQYIRIYIYRRPASPRCSTALPATHDVPRKSGFTELCCIILCVFVPLKLLFLKIIITARKIAQITLGQRNSRATFSLALRHTDFVDINTLYFSNTFLRACS